MIMAMVYGNGDGNDDDADDCNSIMEWKQIKIRIRETSCHNIGLWCVSLL